MCGNNSVTSGPTPYPAYKPVNTTSATNQPYHESILFALIIGECTIIDPSISTQISGNGHILTISNITEEDMVKLVFPTNTDNNNNKLSLINVSVSLDVNPTKPVIIPGLTQQFIYAFNTNNSKAYRKLEFLHRPFAEIPAGDFSPYKPTLTAPELTDTLAGITSFTESTYGKRKLYSLTLSNDRYCPGGTQIPGGGCVPN